MSFHAEELTVEILECVNRKPPPLVADVVAMSHSRMAKLLNICLGIEEIQKDVQFWQTIKRALEEWERIKP